MIIGSCPHCDEPTMTQIAPHLPCYSVERCEACGKDYWLKHSRLDPVAYKDKPSDCGGRLDDLRKPEEPKCTS